MNTAEFLKNELIYHLKHLGPNELGAWGKMNAQQMVEHLVDTFKIANGKLKVDSNLPPDIIERNYKFLQSDIPFKENTKNPLLPETPMEHRYQTIQQALDALQAEINEFFKVYEGDDTLKINNPVFGDLNFEDQLRLLDKHTKHHLKQFGLIK